MSSSSFLYPKLNNCYIPLRQIGGVEDGSSTNSDDSRPTKRTKHDDDSDATRPTSDSSDKGERLSSHLMKINVIPNADGSSSVECLEGSTKVICAVHGPRDISTTSTQQQHYLNSGGGNDGSDETTSSVNAYERGSLSIKVKFASTFALLNQTIATQMTSSSATVSSSSNNLLVQYHRKHMLEEMEFEFETKIYNAIVGSIPLELYPKSSIEVCLQIIESGHSPNQTLAACIHSAILALVDAGIECKYLVTCSTVVVGVAESTGDGSTSTTDENKTKTKKEPNISYLINPTFSKEEFNKQKFQPIMSITLAMGLTFASGIGVSDNNDMKQEEMIDVQMMDEYVTLWEQQSLQQTKNSKNSDLIVGLTSKQHTKAMELLREQCHKIHKHLVDVLMTHYYNNDQETHASN